MAYGSERETHVGSSLCWASVCTMGVKGVNCILWDTRHEAASSVTALFNEKDARRVVKTTTAKELKESIRIVFHVNSSHNCDFEGFVNHSQGAAIRLAMRSE